MSPLRLFFFLNFVLIVVAVYFSPPCLSRYWSVGTVLVEDLNNKRWNLSSAPRRGPREARKARSWDHRRAGEGDRESRE